MRKLLGIGLVLLTVAMSACKEHDTFIQMPSHIEAGLSGQGGQPITPTPTPTSSATPIYEHTTVIQLLTPTIINNAPDQFLQVQVSYQGPGGSQADFPFNRMRFDVASVNMGTIEDLPYTVTVSNSLSYQGLLRVAWGSDLFGNTGDNYFHTETEDLLDIPEGVTWFLFSVDLSNTENHRYGWSSGDPVPDQEQIQVYVQFGDESMVASAPVTFINNQNH